MIRFAERMEGTVTIGTERKPFSFDVDARGPASGAPLVLAGTVRIEGLCPDTPVDAAVSRLEVGVPLRRHIRYTLAWTDAQGRRWRFFGEKTARLLRPLSTMTTLPGAVYRDGLEVGPALLRFPLRTLPSFLLSFFRRPSLPAPAPARTVTPQPVTPPLAAVR
jgi:hypothetical protein